MSSVKRTEKVEHRLTPAAADWRVTKRERERKRARVMRAVSFLSCGGAFPQSEVATPTFVCYLDRQRSHTNS